MPPTVHAREIAYIDPFLAFQPFAGDSGAVFLDSAQVTDRLGRYSFITSDPFLTLRSKNGAIQVGNRHINGDPFEVLRSQLARYPLAHRAGLPPFQTGVAGYFAYDLAHHLETLPTPDDDDMKFPDLILGFYDVVIAFDQMQQRAWILASGYPEQKPINQASRAQSRIQEFRGRLDSVSGPTPAANPTPVVPSPTSGRGREHREQERGHSPPLNIETLPYIKSNFSRPAYEAAVQRVIDYIYAGDIFQANVSQRFRAQLPPDDSPLALYQRLRAINPAPFAAYLNFDDTVIASASPERFLLLRDGWVETRPIKGTRPRGDTPEKDHHLADELLDSEKDRAENIMIVDLLRNDLSRICQDHSVKTPELCILESFATVHHLVSTVEGRLNPGADAIDLLRVTVPGGSITGAPKIRAMEIIAELEPTWRGPYCGNVGYISFSGDMDTSIIIRTYAIRGNTVTFQAGGGIVADSDPAAEYDETLDKARALIDALKA
ncbi:MAG: aminodeoxychorismate synthase component I [Chloroflexota bacterium]|nr:aminodeoxychorismate synthase component I [Chloroflexota bacterium]